mgnify:CR=1 FL=1
MDSLHIKKTKAVYYFGLSTPCNGFGAPSVTNLPAIPLPPFQLHVMDSVEVVEIVFVQQ